MIEQTKIRGFSQLETDEKRKIIAQACFNNQHEADYFNEFTLNDKALQETFEQFSENTLTNHHLPFGVIPNVRIDDRIYHVPAVIEESSVIAAAAKAASFWFDRGGFKTIDERFVKNGQVYFSWNNTDKWLETNKNKLFSYLKNATSHLTESMEKRGGGITGFDIKKLTDNNLDAYKLTVYFNTADSMGANFINTVLEEIANALPLFAEQHNMNEPEIIMAILSNYTPENSVTLELSCPVEELTWNSTLPPKQFAEKFVKAMQIAQNDVSRAVTHNKGIMNGTDAVVLATGNDYRATEAAVHAFASEGGQYSSLSKAEISDGIFRMQLKLPMALGTVGGLTKIHPTASLALKMLNNPTAPELMKIAAAAGLANNFAAVAALVSTGIQHGHMKLHLNNILMSENATQEQRRLAKKWFANRTVSVQAVRAFLQNHNEMAQ
ncbi:MAG: hypothetical protein PF489_09445 [Salinivirgaceae bacterium]|jgi:hydroxymethylglutaryl-CoA reductase|nr:hypothetical protein [Salinivirgaceae bacterium]